MGPILGKLNAIVAGANALPSTMSLGILLGTLIFGPVVDRFGYKWLLIASSAFALAGIQGLANFQEIELLHASSFCLGLGGGILNGETNALVSDIYDDEHRGGKLGLLGAFYCIGALLWTILHIFIDDFTIPLNMVSIVMAAFIVYFLFISFPPAKPAENISIRKSVGLLKYPALLLLGLVLFFESGLEGAQGNFTISYLIDKAGMNSAAANLAMTFFTIGMLAGRLPLGIFTRKLGYLKVLFTYLIAALAGSVILFWAPIGSYMAYISVVLIGFGIGATYPVILNYVGGAFKKQSGTAISIALFIALVGQYICNKVTGLAFDAQQYNTLPILLTIAVVCMMIVSPVAISTSKKVKE